LLLRGSPKPLEYCPRLRLCLRLRPRLRPPTEDGGLQEALLPILAKFDVSEMCGEGETLIESKERNEPAQPERGA
jgi:hypothetical protein